MNNEFDNFIIETNGMVSVKKLQCVIGTIFQKRRKFLKIKQSNLANKIGCTPSALSKIENGFIDLKLSQFISLCIALDLNSSDVFKEANNYRYSQVDNSKTMEVFLSKDVANSFRVLIDHASLSRKQKAELNTLQLAESSEYD